LKNLDSGFHRNDRKGRFSTFYEAVKIDAIVKSLRRGHSREGGSPELFDIPGFPSSRE